MGLKDSFNNNFMVEIQNNKKYSPLMIAAVCGRKEIIELMVRNKTTDVDVTEKITGVNAFWLAARYGHGDCF